MATTQRAARSARARKSPQRTLERYREKRDFDVTPEPPPKRVTKRAAARLGFVVQKHAARALHYDFRLELNGVLLSWSVPKGPSLSVKDRRLAVRTEDHPLAYADFEGIIPQGEYGGGTVLVWDRGTWQPHGDAQKALDKGHLEFELEGEKLRGRFHLVRRTREDDQRENWLLFKGRDAAADDEVALTEERPESVLSGRTIEEVAEQKPRVWHSNRKETKKPAKSRVKRPARTLPPPPSDAVALVKRLPTQFPLTNLEKVLYPEQGLRKAELIAYLVAISPWMLPHVAGRPLTLVRCPEGRHRSCFFQKHAKDSVPDVVTRVAIAETSTEQDYMTVHDAMGLVALAQLGALELHTWPCHADKVERPDQFVFDLDPHESLPFSAVSEAALDVRRRLDQLGLVSFVKTTGGKGLHVVVPLTRRHAWDEHKAFAQAFVARMAESEPARFVINPRKDLRKGRIFLDYLRNGRGATAVAPYSTRAREGATVAAPITWDELTPELDPTSFHVTSMMRRMEERSAEPWADYHEVRQALTASAQRAVRTARR